MIKKKKVQGGICTFVYCDSVIKNSKEKGDIVSDPSLNLKINCVLWCCVVVLNLFFFFYQIEFEFNYLLWTKKNKKKT